MGPRLLRKRKHSHIESNLDRTEAKTCFDDRLSNLPPEILDKIFVKLPMREAVRASVLSREWRYRWKHLSQLAFCYTSMPSSYTKSLTHLLENNQCKQLDRVCLSSCFAGNEPVPHHWIDILSTKVVKDVTILEHQSQGYPMLPPLLFSFKHLVHLRIICCEIVLPSSFQGFKLLQSLHLRGVTISDTHFHTLIFNCSNLEKLTLERFARRDSLENKKLIINSPSLEHLEMVYDKHEKISFEDCPRITSIAIVPKLCSGDCDSYFNYWDFDSPDRHFLFLPLPENNGLANQAQIAQLERETAIDLFNALESCSSLERISLPAKLFEYIFKFLDLDDMKAVLPCKRLHLKTIHFTQLNCRNGNSVPGFLVMLIFSSNLELLNFSVSYSGCDKPLGKILRGLRKQRFLSFKKLRYVKTKFTYAYELTPALDLLKLIVGSAPVLETVTLRKEGDRTRKVPEKFLQKAAEKLKRVVCSPHVMFRYEFKGPPGFSSPL